jgi:hypothetical protein
VVDDDCADTTGPFLRALSLHYPRLKVVVPSGNIWQEYLNAWCEMEARYQSTKSATARRGRPSGSFNQIQKVCHVILAAKRA